MKSKKHVKTLQPYKTARTVCGSAFSPDDTKITICGCANYVSIIAVGTWDILFNVKIKIISIQRIALL